MKIKHIVGPLIQELQQALCYGPSLHLLPLDLVQQQFQVCYVCLCCVV